MTRQLAWWLGCAFELATRCRPRIGWRSYQRWARILTHARDVSVCLAAILLWGVAIWAASL